MARSSNRRKTRSSPSDSRARNNYLRHGFRERLREWRLKRGFTQHELAMKADVPTISVSHFETGHRFPNSESLARLADALGVSADYFLGRVRDPVGTDIVASDPEIAVLLRCFQRMSKQARQQVKEVFEILDAADRKRRSRPRKKK